MKGEKPSSHFASLFRFRQPSPVKKLLVYLGGAIFVFCDGIKMEAIIYYVKDITGKSSLFLEEDAQKIFELLKQKISRKERVVLSFDGIGLIISYFLNIAIGQLYGVFEEEEIVSSLQIEKMSPDDIEMLEIVINNAKEYYSNLHKRTCKML